MRPHRGFRTGEKACCLADFFPRQMVLAFALSILCLLSTSTFAQDPSTARVSVADNESQANGGSHSVDISGDGRYITFASSASNLVSGGTGTFDVYVRDQTLGTTELVSQSTSGTAGNSTSGWPSISRDGRYVAFMSVASTLVSDDDNGNADVFLHDRISGTTTLISREIDGTPGAGRSEKPDISADGMHVAFVSTAPDLVIGVTGNHTYVYHVVTDTIELISQSSGEVPGNGSSSHDFPSISDDGRYVVFRSTSTNLDPDHVFPNSAGIFLRNTVNGTTDQYRAGFSYRDPAISGNGDWIAYRFGFTIYGTQRTNTTPEDLTTLFSFTSPGGPFEQLRWSADGRFLVFFQQEGPFSFDPWRPRVYDRVKDNFIEVAITHDGLPIDRGGAAPNTFGAAGISDNGRFVAFWAEGTSIVLGDTNGVEDVFLRDIGDILGPNVNGLLADPDVANTTTPVMISATIDDGGRGDSVVASAEISLDEGGYQPLSAVDGAFDSPAELVSASFVGLSGGIHRACVRGTDAIGNTGSSQCVSFEVTVEGWPLKVKVLAIDDLNGGFPAGNSVYVRALVSTLLIPTDLVDNSAGRTTANGSTIDPPWEYNGLTRSDQNPAIVLLEVWEKKTFADEKLDAAPGVLDQVIFSVDLDTGEFSDFPFGRYRCSKGDTPGRAVRICYEIELSRDVDPDGDAIPTIWEINGIDVDGDGVIDVDLPAMGADPMRKDIFVEIDCLFSDGRGDGDYTDDQDHNHCPLQATLMNAVQAFANAPVDNPDGSKGIQLHIDVGNFFEFATGVVLVPRSTREFGAIGSFGNLGGFGGGGSQIDEKGNEIIEFPFVGKDWIGDGSATNFYDLKSMYFNENRLPVFHYNIWGHQTNLRQRVHDCTSGLAERFANSVNSREERVADDFIVTLGGLKDVDGDGSPDRQCNRGKDANGFVVGNLSQQTGTFLHELGHNLGLDHGGRDGTHFKPNYLSVVNYSYQSCGENSVFKKTNLAGQLGLAGQCDFSRVSVDLDETSLDECAGIDDPEGLWTLGTIDWNGNGISEGVTCTSANMNSDGEWSTENIAFDVNNDNVCVRTGDNGSFDTIPAGDDRFGLDVRGRPVINDGADRICDTVPDETSTDDVKAKYANSNHPVVLKGFDDWANLIFDYRVKLNYEVSADAASTDPEELEEAQTYLAALVAPDVSASVSAPAAIDAGSLITYELIIGNTGRGPALGAIIDSEFPDGSTASNELNVISRGSEHQINIEWIVPVDNFGESVARFNISFDDLSGQTYNLDPILTTTEVLDPNNPPQITLSVNPLVLEGNVLAGWSGDLTMVAGVTASDPDGDPVTLINDAPSFFPLGVTTVTWTADDGKATTSLQQSVSVIDSTAPSIDPVADISVTTTEAGGEVVSYSTPDTSDIVDDSPEIACDFSSGTIFPVGTTTVTCAAADDSGNIALISFNIEVVLDQGALDLIEAINVLSPGDFVNRHMQRALTNKILAVLRMIERGDYTEALDKLTNDLLPKTDGCAISGFPDSNDWITSCVAQSLIYGLVLAEIEFVRRLI